MPRFSTDSSGVEEREGGEWSARARIGEWKMWDLGVRGTRARMGEPPDYGSQISLYSGCQAAFPYEEHADPENGEDGWDDP